MHSLLMVTSNFIIIGNSTWLDSTTGDDDTINLIALMVKRNESQCFGNPLAFV